MITMTTTKQHTGTVARRARLVAPVASRSAAAGFGGRGTTGVGVVPSHTVMATDTTEPAAVTANACPTIWHPARHLGPRTT